jgi:hypothetical protein
MDKMSSNTESLSLFQFYNLCWKATPALPNIQPSSALLPCLCKVQVAKPMAWHGTLLTASKHRKSGKLFADGILDFVLPCTVAKSQTQVFSACQEMVHTLPGEWFHLP